MSSYNGQSFGAFLSDIDTLMEFIIPVGTCLPYAGKTAPAGWLICDGEHCVDATGHPQFAELLGADESGKVYAPDLTGRYIKGGTSGYKLNDGNVRTPLYVWSTASMTNAESKYGYGVTAEKDKIELPNVELTWIIKY